MMLKTITEAEFEQEVLRVSTPVLVDFYADWCGPCQALAPLLEEISQETSIPVVKVNVDENPQLAQAYRVMTIPTMILFKDGGAFKKLIGLVEKEELEAILSMA